MYGLENYILDPPFSLLVSILGFLGISTIGNTIFSISQKHFGYLNLKYKYFFYPIIGTYIILFLGHIFISLGIGKLFITLFSYIILFLGLYPLFLIFDKIFNKQNKLISLNFENYLIILLFIGLFLISISPITHSDSLDYHLNGAINLINTGVFHKELLPMHDHLVSLGEIIIALGLNVGAEQLGAIVQFGSLLSLIPLFNTYKNKNNILLVFILVTPVTLFLVSSPKPQILYSISTLIILSILINLEKKNYYKFDFIYPIFFLILFINTIVKYSFILSSFLLSVYLFYICWKKSKLYKAILVSLFIAIIIYLPNWYFRYENFNTFFPQLILSPLPINIYGFENHHNLLSGGSIKILELFIPKNLSEFSHTYGPLLLFLFFLINRNILFYKIPLILIFFFFTGIFLFGSNLSRFLYEGFLWLTYLIYLNYDNRKLIYKIFKLSTLLQSVLILSIIVFFTTNLTIGSFSLKKRDSVMTKFADGYMISKWANKRLEKDDKLISFHRSISLFNVKTYSDIFTWHINPEDNRSHIYFNFIKDNKINKILFHGKEKDFYPFENCLGKELFFGENIGRKTGRNPFSRAEFYNGWIYEFNYQNLPKCISK